MTSLIFHLLFLTLTLGFTFAWTRVPSLAPYTLQIIGVQILLYYIGRLLGSRFIRSYEKRVRSTILSQIIATEETDTLLWLSTKAKPTLVNLLDTTSQIISSNLLPFNLQQKLKSLHADLIALHQSADELKAGIDKTTDD